MQTEEFLIWYQQLDEFARVSIYEEMLVLKEIGPKMGRPYVDTIKGSKYKNIKI